MNRHGACSSAPDERGTALVNGRRVPAVRVGLYVLETDADGRCPACSDAACRGRMLPPDSDFRPNARLEVEYSATTYAERDDDGRYGVDVLTFDVEYDDNGDVVARADATWAWEPAPPGTTSWGPDDADDHLSSLGWTRTGPWRWWPDLAGVGPGWSAPIARDGGAS